MTGRYDACPDCRPPQEDGGSLSLSLSRSRSRSRIARSRARALFRSGFVSLEHTLSRSLSLSLSRCCARALSLSLEGGSQLKKQKKVVNALAHHTGPVVSVKKSAPAQILSDVPGASQTNPPDGAHHNNPQPKDDE